MGAARRVRSAVSNAAIAKARRALADLDELLGEEKLEPLHLTVKLCDQFLCWSRKRNSRTWVRAQWRILKWWRAELPPRIDLRELDLVKHVLPALDRAKGARAHRIAVLKKLCAWLRYDRHLLAAADDPTASLRVPQNTPAQWKRSKIVPLASIEKTREQLGARQRDVLDILLGTAWHLTEVERFAHAGELLPAPPQQVARGAAAVLCTRHKSRAPHLTAVSAPVLAAAKRLRERGGLSVSNFAKALRAATRAAHVAPWTPGCLRHTVSSHALEQGTDDAAVASFLGHADKRTTRRWYILWVAPAKIPTLA